MTCITLSTSLYYKHKGLTDSLQGKAYLVRAQACIKNKDQSYGI